MYTLTVTHLIWLNRQSFNLGSGHVLIVQSCANIPSPPTITGPPIFKAIINQENQLSLTTRLFLYLNLGSTIAFNTITSLITQSPLSTLPLPPQLQCHSRFSLYFLLPLRFPLLDIFQGART